MVGSLLFALNHRSREIRLGRRLQITLATGTGAGSRAVFRWKAGGVRHRSAGSNPAVCAAGRGRQSGGDHAGGPGLRADAEVVARRGAAGIQLRPGDRAHSGTGRDTAACWYSCRPGGWLDAAWSPDGKSIVYASGDSVLVRAVDGTEARGLARLTEAHSCSWSPNGRWVACVSGNGQFVRNEDFGNIATSSIWVIPSAGGAPVKVTDDEWLNTSPAWLPGGSSLLYISNREGGRDLYQVELGRSGRPAHEGVRLSTGLNAATVSVAAAGNRLAYATFSRIANVWTMPLPRSGTVNLSRAQPVTNGSQEIEGFDLSPDQRWLVFDSNRGGVQQIYRMQMGGAEVEQLTNGDSPSLAPAFSFDGREVGFHSFREGVRQLFAMQVDGGTPVQVTAEKTHSRIVNWSPDGRSLVFVRNALSPEQETAIVSRDASGRWGAPRTVLKGGAAGVWSPDGTKVATQMQIDRGKFAVAVVPARGGTPRVLGRPQDRQELGWAFSSDSKFVYYIPNTSFGERVGIWRAPVDGGPSQPVAWYDGSPGGLSRSTVRVRGNRLYINIGDPQSDVWVTEIGSEVDPSPQASDALPYRSSSPWWLRGAPYNEFRHECVTGVRPPSWSLVLLRLPLILFFPPNPSGCPRIRAGPPSRAGNQLKRGSEGHSLAEAYTRSFPLQRSSRSDTTVVAWSAGPPTSCHIPARWSRFRLASPLGAIPGSRALDPRHPVEHHSARWLARRSGAPSGTPTRRRGMRSPKLPGSSASWPATNLWRTAGLIERTDIDPARAGPGLHDLPVGC